MEIKVLGCYGGETNERHASGFLIEGRTLLEAGVITSALSMETQLALNRILVSHAHLDHLKELIFLVDNFFIHNVGNVRVLGISEVMTQLRKHVFNDQIWPDFTKLPKDGTPILVIEELKEGVPNAVGDLTVTPVRVSHTVPATGFIISKGEADVVYSGDTGPTREIWKRAGELPNLKAVIVETSFPDEMRDLALESGHLTPALLAQELVKLGRPEVPVFSVHMKPAFEERIIRQLSSLSGWRIAPFVQGAAYTF